MSNGSESIVYGLYSDPAHSQPWGDTSSGGTVTGTGTAATQKLTVYGRVRSQRTPSPGVHSDTVVVEVAY